ncbi:hypothetical protein GQ44DRAFT_766844 [Phaeosphaeriaceae sp. PMI808]|nr:hypothetical protein GQ44DRAFT_766844 [Phaeosphaeriaceae sp. PMI808]
MQLDQDQPLSFSTPSPGAESLTIKKESQWHIKELSHHKSIFEYLPYDIRAIIYSYLEPNSVPPLAPKFECLGFLLSCRKAKQELEEIASDRLGAYLECFHKTKNFEARVKKDEVDVRNLTITLPFTAFDVWGTGYTNQVQWNRKVFTGLHPLLSQYFGTLRIHIANNFASSNVPPHSTLVEKGQLEVAMHKLLRDISCMIERVRRAYIETSNSSNVQPHLDVIFGYEQNSTAYPTTPVRAKRICLSWNLQPTGSEEIALNGILCHTRQLYISTSLQPQVPNHFSGAKFYRLHDIQHLVGEMGIISPSRWSQMRDTSLNLFLNESTAKNKRYVSGKKLGGEIGEGLVGMKEEEFETEEDKVKNALWAT